MQELFLKALDKKVYKILILSSFYPKGKHNFSEQTLLRKLYLYQICTKLYFKSLLFEERF